MSIVEKYWAGVLQRLEAEVSVFARLVAHHGEQGRENEAVLARILTSFVPRRYGVGSGLIIDADDQYSRQTDIVIFEQSDEPAVLAQTTQLLFPVESVLASIEVKTTLRATDVADAIAKATEQRKLTPRRHYADSSDHPLFVLLAYSGGASPESLLGRLMAAPPEGRPDLACVIEQGLFVGGDGEGGHRTGLALLRDDEGDLVEAEPTGPEMRADFRGRSYPLIKRGDSHVLVHSSRALLLFVEELVRRVAAKQDRPEPVVSHYVDDALRVLDDVS